MVRSVKCPVATSLDLVGDKWSLLVIRDLLKGRSRFGELRESAEGIPPAVLSRRLKDLEAAGAVRKRLYQDHPPRYAYQLTAKGHGLGVVVGALAAWGEQYAESDLSLVDGECGHGLRVVYHCPTCARGAPAAVCAWWEHASPLAAWFAAPLCRKYTVRSTKSRSTSCTSWADGWIASGQITVDRFFQDRDVPVIDADVLGHRTL